MAHSDDYASSVPASGALENVGLSTVSEDEHGKHKGGLGAALRTVVIVGGGILFGIMGLSIITVLRVLRAPLLVMLLTGYHKNKSVGFLGGSSDIPSKSCFKFLWNISIAVSHSRCSGSPRTH